MAFSSNKYAYRDVYSALMSMYFLYLSVCTDCLWVFLPEINVFVVFVIYNIHIKQNGM